MSAVPAPAHTPGRRSAHLARERAQRGQSLLEYLLVVGLAVIVLAIGPSSPLQRVFDAFGQRYQTYTEAMSRP